jgi:hypothetical protein
MKSREFSKIKFDNHFKSKNSLKRDDMRNIVQASFKPNLKNLDLIH